MNDKEKQQLVSEVNILRELRHSNIVRYYDRIIDKQRQKIYIVMEHCEGGDLGKMINDCKSQNKHLPEERIWKFLSQVCQGLYECHRRKDGKILHRDIKPANLLLDKDYNIKLGDFGLARIMNSDSVYAYSTVGTSCYTSPELISEAAYTEKCDIWSIGCCFYELAALQVPFNSSNQIELA